MRGCGDWEEYSPQVVRRLGDKRRLWILFSALCAEIRRLRGLGRIISAKGAENGAIYP